MDKLIICLATLGPIGKKLPAPGTFGSLAGLVVFGTLMATQMGDGPMTIHCSFAILALLSIPICGQAERILAKKTRRRLFWTNLWPNRWFLSELL